MRIYKTIIYICMWRGKGGDGWSRSLISGGHQTHHTKLRSAPFGAIYFEEGGSPASFAAARFICRSVLPVGKKKEGRKGLERKNKKKKREVQSACCVKRVTARVGEAILDHHRLQISLLEGVGFQPKGRWKVGADWDCPHALSKTKKEETWKIKLKKKWAFALLVHHGCVKTITRALNNVSPS